MGCSFHAEQKLLRYAANTDKQPVVLITDYTACPNRKDTRNAIKKSIGSYLTCTDLLKEAQMYTTSTDSDYKQVYRWLFYVPRIW
ncbi:hypothetical protein CFREI_04260 [Corynebacterium freiburgense]|nr:hypothetical protein CFREI_04260 [Corynebacterium freiburgense]